VLGNRLVGLKMAYICQRCHESAHDSIKSWSWYAILCMIMGLLPFSLRQTASKSPVLSVCFAKAMAGSW